MIPRFAPGVRLKFDAVRERHVLLAPERVIALDETAHAVLALVDGRKDMQAIAEALAAAYDAPADAIAEDAQALLNDLHLQGLVRL